MSKVLVTGASGFLALHIVGQLLAEGYQVIGTVRSQSKADHLSNQFKNSNLQFVIVPDIKVKGAFDAVFKEHNDIEYVLHTASPFSFGLEGKLEDIYLKPAVDGTLNALTSVKEFAPQVKKVVITSSMAAIEDKSSPDLVLTEDVWNPLEWSQVNNENLAYVASKKLAEKAAWDFVKENKDSVKFQLVTVNPPFIFGPQFFDSDAANPSLNTSASVIAGLLKSDPSDTHLFSQPALCAVDVRDVAKFHLFAIEKDTISNQRLFPIVSRFTSQGILDIINANFKNLNIAKGDPAKESTIFTPKFDNSKSIEAVGGYDFITLEKQVIDTVNQVLKFGTKL